MLTTSFSCPAKTCAGIRALEHLPFELGAMSASKPMVIHEAGPNARKEIRLLKQAFGASGMPLGISSIPPEDTAQNDPGIFVRDLYDHFREKGFDALIALGGTLASDQAKALNIAVSLGPDALKQAQICQPLSPLVFVPTGSNSLEGASAATRYKGRAFDSPFLSPDLVLIDPRLIQTEDRSLLLDRALTCLALGCEVFCFSPSFPARAYGAAAAALSRSALEKLLASGLKGPDNLKTAARENLGVQKELVQATVMAGYLSTGVRPLYTLALGRAMAAQGSLPLGQLMILVLPAVLESQSSTGLEQLLVHLLAHQNGAKDFSVVPYAQRSLAAVQEIRSLINRLFSLSHGLLPRTLEEAGWSQGALDNLATRIQNSLNQTGNQTGNQVGNQAGSQTDNQTGTQAEYQPEYQPEYQADRLTRILAAAWNGRPMVN